MGWAATLRLGYCAPMLSTPAHDLPHTLPGGCHCAAVRFQVVVRVYEALVCSCSICHMKGLVHLIVPPEDFRLLSGADALTAYRFHTQTAAHTFCAHCGVQAFYTPRSHPEHVDVNVRCLDGDVEERFVLTDFDGAAWEEHIHEIQREP